VRYPRIASAFLIIAVTAPLLVSGLSLVHNPESLSVWRESNRIGTLLGNTILLAIVAGVLAVPAGTALALLLSRGRVTGTRAAYGFLLLALFVPLPVTAVAWQIILGSWLPSFALDPGQVAWRPWQQGLLPAAFVHGMAGIPWVVWIAWAVLARTDSHLEDAARLEGGTRAVLRKVLLPRVGVAMAASLAWVAVMAATEIPVTDAMMVRTIAEEVYAELVGNPAGVAAAVAVSIPVWIVSSVFAVMMIGWILKRRPPSRETNAPIKPAFPASHLMTLGTWFVILIVAGLPLAALVWKAGGGGTNLGFRIRVLSSTISTQFLDSGSAIALSLLAALGAGVLATALAWYLSATLGRTRTGTMILVASAMTIWLAPGPIVGLGMKDTSSMLLSMEESVLATTGWKPDFPPLRTMLYDQPSPVPAIWASTVRFFPVAVAMILPAMLAVPKELWDQARLDGLGIVFLFRRVIAPLTGPAANRAFAAVAVLSLGEVSASKLVQPPAYRSYILDVFNQMHYGAEATVAGLCLVQIAMTGVTLFVLAKLVGPSPFVSRPVC
jgi:iron(III) transport system permease protein